MKDKDVREIQLSSSYLALIFIMMLIVGCVIFILGISVGRRQGLASREFQAASEQLTEQVSQQKPVPAAEEPAAKETIGQELASHQKVQEKAETPTPPPKAENGPFFIQVGAYSQKSGAEGFAQGLRRQGFTIVILDPFPRDRRPIYRVRVGGFRTKEEAEQVLERLVNLENKKKPDYFIIQE